MSAKLTQNDVKEIFDILDASSFDEIRIETSDLKIHIRRNAKGDESESRSWGDERKPAKAVDHEAAPAADKRPSSDDLLDIKAPLLGTFYRMPKPGAEPFVQIGSKVEPDTVIGIIEVMKLMNSLTAGVSGEVAEFAAADGELVEYDQVIMRVRKAS